MKYCIKCGHAADDNAAFCPNCGSALAAAPQNIPPQPNPQQYAPPQPNPQYAPQQFGAPVYAVNTSASPIVGLIKSEGGKVLFLVACIAYSVALAISSFSGSIADVSSTYFNYSFNPNVASLLNCLGLWLFYSWAVRPYNGAKPSTAGLTVIRVMTILSIVAVSIMIGVYTVSVIMYSNKSLADSVEKLLTAYNLDKMDAGMAVFILTLAIAALVLVLIYFVRVLSCINNIKGCLITGAPGKPLSKFVIVMNFIISAFSIIKAAYTLINGSTTGTSGVYYAVEIAGLAASVATAVACVCITLCMISYNKRLQELYPSAAAAL